MADRNLTSFPIPANYISAAKVPYDNTGSGLTATDTQAAVDEVIGNLSAFSGRFIYGYKNLTNASSSTLVDLGIIPNSLGYYVAFLQAGTNTADCASAYIFLYGNQANTFNVTPIYEGTGSRAPRITSTGVLQLNSSTSSSRGYYLLIKMD